MAIDAPHDNLLLADAYEGIQDVGVYVKDLEGRYLMINAAGAAFAGLEPDQLVGRTDLEVFPAYGPSIRAVDDVVIANDASRTYEDVVGGDGELRVFLTTKSPLRDASGAVIGVIGISTDITARKAAEDEVRRREATLAESQAVAKVGSWDRDLVRGNVEWSEEMYRMLGLDPEELEPTFEAFVAAIHPDDREVLTAAVDEAAETGTSFEVECRIIRPDGEVRTLLARGRCFLDADGDPVRTVGAAVDITERKLVEERLREREAALAEAQAVSGVGSWETDLVKDTQRWSDELYRLIGVDPDEYEPTLESAPQFIHPDDRERVLAAFDKSRQAGGYFESEYRIVRPDGETRHVIARARTFTDFDGKPVRNVGAALDITERKRSRDLLEARQALLNTSHELTKVGGFEWDLASDQVTWSEGLYLIFGMDRDGEGAGTFEGYLELVPPEDRDERRRKIEQVLETGKPASDEYRILRPDGKVRWIESRMTALTDSAGKTTRLVGACQDITERKAGVERLERDLETARSRPLRDSLTHLANRTLALDRLEHAFDLAKLGDSDLSVVLIDIDGFKDLNERHGQLFGDSVLLLAAEQLRSCTRESDTLARVGGDEFLVICEDVDLAPGTLATTENLRQTFGSPLELERTGATIEITFSIGSSSIGDRSVPRARQLLEEAEEALTWARTRGRGGFAQHSGDVAKTNGHRAGPSIERLNSDPAKTNGSPAGRSPAEKLLRRMYEVWGSDERDEWMSSFHEEIEYISSAAVSGFDPIYRGHEGMRRLHSHLQQNWESIEALVLSFEQRGDHFVAFLLVSAVMKVSGAKIEISFHQGGTMRDGLIYRLDSYESRSEAFEALGADD
ncbi:MAG: hypothetical protein QOG93_2369 [Gaiellaceae bacterium]|nr:hypothetical protein [Gaiellaceae bacterium]